MTEPTSAFSISAVAVYLIAVIYKNLISGFLLAFTNISGVSTIPKPLKTSWNNTIIVKIAVLEAISSKYLWNYLHIFNSFITPNIPILYY